MSDNSYYNSVKNAIENNDIPQLVQLLNIIPKTRSEINERNALFIRHGIASANYKIIQAFLNQDYIEFDYWRFNAIRSAMDIDVCENGNCSECRPQSIYNIPNRTKHITNEEAEDLAIYLLKDARSNIDENYNSYLFHATISNYSRIFKYIIEHISDIKSKIISIAKSDVLYYACDHDTTGIFNMLISIGVDPTYSSRCIYTAAIMGSFEIVKTLLSFPKVKAGIYNSKALYEACRHGYSEIALLLIPDNRINCSAINNRALKEALKKKLTDVVDALYNKDCVKLSMDDVLKNKVQKYLNISS